jgi:hypothetical protein
LEKTPSVFPKMEAISILTAREASNIEIGSQLRTNRKRALLF